jgi:protein-S-isoprenylcysteine O-methyltransferase Ste14
MVLVFMVIFCVVLVIVVIAHSRPPESQAERKLKRRYIEYRNRLREVQRKAEQDR